MPAPPDEESRANRFMRSALAILGETGKADFTVLEVVERSKTSLRSFYQHFSTKDELLLALIDRIMTESTASWREDTDGLDAVTGADVSLIDRISSPASSTTQDSINRGPDLLQRPPRRDLAARIRPGAVTRARPDQGHHRARHRRGQLDPALNVESTTALIMQAALGAMRLRVLGAELNGVPIDGDHIYEFCQRALRK